jgi:biopolymer transport protein ExbD
MKIPRINSSKKAKIEIIPMIDVMFFLLATVMMASISMQQFNGVVVNLTKGKASEIVPKEHESITLSITHDGLIYINKQQISLLEINNYFKNLKDFKEEMIIASDSEAKQGLVMQAMIEAKKAGIKKFTFIIRKFINFILILFFIIKYIFILIFF